MGWGAAMAFYEENSGWLDSVDEAYDVLYGRTVAIEAKPKRHRKPFQCGQCHRRFKTAQAASDHQRDYHQRAEFECPACQRLCRGVYGLSAHMKAEGCQA